MPIAPEAATSPTQSAPADRKTLEAEQWARDGLTLFAGDRVLDKREKQILFGFFKELHLRTGGGLGLGNGGTPQTPGEVPQSPMEMNANTEDMGTVEGATPEGEY